METANTGKPVAVTLSEEIPPLVDQIRFFAGAARHLEGKSAGEYMKDHTSFVRREPIGVCAAVTPWNYPLMMAVWKWAPALAAGNTMVLKPSDTTPASTVLMAEIMSEFLPDGAFNVICGDRETGRLLVDHPTPAMVSITGSVRAGMEVAAAASADLKRVHLELGGKAPCVVFDDADIAAAAEGIAIAGYFNAGQDCTAATRVLAGPAVYDDFVSALAEQARGPDGRRARCARRRLRATEQCRAAVPAHRLLRPTAVARRGGDRGDTGRGAWLLLRPVDHRRLGAESTRSSNRRCSGRPSPCSASPTRNRPWPGPTASSYGLASSVWTKDHARAMRMAKGLDFGAVWINTHIPIVAEMPHGGFKHSGYGKDLSSYGFEDYTRIKHVMSYIGT